MCVWDEPLPLTHAPRRSSFSDSGRHHFGTHPPGFVSLSGHRGVQTVYQLPPEFLRGFLYLHADVHQSYSFSGDIMKDWDETNPVSPRATSSPSRSHDLPFAHHLEMEGETRTGFPESLRGCSALLS